MEQLDVLLSELQINRHQSLSRDFQLAAGALHVEVREFLKPDSGVTSLTETETVDGSVLFTERELELSDSMKNWILIDVHDAGNENELKIERLRDENDQIETTSATVVTLESDTTCSEIHKDESVLESTVQESPESTPLEMEQFFTPGKPLLENTTQFYSDDEREFDHSSQVDEMISNGLHDKLVESEVVKDSGNHSIQFSDISFDFSSVSESTPVRKEKKTKTNKSHRRPKLANKRQRLS